MIRKMFNKRMNAPPLISRKPMDKSLNRALVITAIFAAILLISAPAFAKRLTSDCIYSTEEGDDPITYKIVDQKLYIQDALIEDAVVNTLLGGGYSLSNKFIEVVIYADGLSTISPFMEFPAYYGQCTEFVGF